VKKIKWLAGMLAILISSPPAWSQEAEPEDPVDQDPMGQVTSVSQLTDVRPGDWAFQALQTLVERYGVIAGYPDRTFRGNQPLTRYEFVAAINQVIGRIEEQLLAGDVGGTAQQDVLTIRRLINAYGVAINNLRSRLDNLSNRIAAQERQQFSTTTKLNARTDLALTSGRRDGLRAIARVRLGLTTSFQGSDRLITELEAGNNETDAIGKAHGDGQNLLGTTGILADGGGLDAAGAVPGLRVRKLYYGFSPTDNLTIAAGPKLPPSDFIDRNSYADQTGDTFSSSFFLNNPLIVQNELDRTSGAGVAIDWIIQPNLSLRGLYAAADSANPTTGIFRDRYQATIEAEYRAQPFTVRLQYSRAEVNGTTINAGGINAEWTTQRRFGVFGLFGRLGFGSYRGFNTLLQQDLDLDPKTWALGASIQNFLIPGSKAGIAIGQPFVTRGLGNATQTNFEAYFGLALSEQINFSPSLLVVSNPNNRASPTIWQWNLRLLYSF
jgi:hypothetical protein